MFNFSILPWSNLIKNQQDLNTSYEVYCVNKSSEVRSDVCNNYGVGEKNIGINSLYNWLWRRSISFFMKFRRSGKII